MKLSIPVGTKRLSLHVWNRFGEEIGCILDEIRPVCGSRVFFWNGTDGRGNSVELGDYLVRLTADDSVASSLLHLEQSVRVLKRATSRSDGRLMQHAVPRRPRLTTISELVRATNHDIDWLRNALQIAIQLELSTLPPYLIARWTIKNPSDLVANSINEIRGEEMLHFELACNLLTSVGGAPLIADEAVVPKYPGPLPGGVHPGLVVSLRKLSTEQTAVFMEIEYPQGGPISLTAVAGPVTIGEFYASILEAFQRLKPTLSTSRQIETSLPMGELILDFPTIRGRGKWRVSYSVRRSQHVREVREVE